MSGGAVFGLALEQPETAFMEIKCPVNTWPEKVIELGFEVITTYTIRELPIRS